jgi:sigma-B regulation protein RsbU (phosphoserine phosphatase)
MGYWNIAVVAHPGPHSLAGELGARLTRAWNSHPLAAFVPATVSQLEDMNPEELNAVVLIADGSVKHPELVRPLTRLEEHHVPVLALFDQNPDAEGVFEHAGVLCESPATSGAVLCARLHGMLHRQREIDRLREDVAVARRSHMGLGDEIAKMHEELQLASQAQRELLPERLRGLHGVTVSALWRPAQYVSGDIYDIVQLDNDHLGLFVADAVGHGMAAALMTMVICQSLTMRVLEDGAWRILDPAEVLTRLNRQMLSQRLHPSRFATAVYAVVDCRYRRIALAGAGHPPPLLLHTDGTNEPLETSGGLLGVFEDEAYDQVEVELRPDDRLLLYTDGFERAFAAGDDDAPTVGKATRYQREFRDLCGDATPDEMIEAVATRLDAEAGSLHQADDLTLLCLHAGALPQESQLAA